MHDDEVVVHSCQLYQYNEKFARVMELLEGQTYHSVHATANAK